MKISTTLNTLNTVIEAGGYDCFKIMGMLRDAGFEYLDYPFFKAVRTDNCLKEHILSGENWRGNFETIREEAEKNSQSFSQTHNLTFNFFRNDEKSEAMNLALDRAIEATAILGAKITVLHPIEPPGADRDVTICLKKNSDFFRKKAETADKFGVKLALENMLSNFRFDGSIYWRYCTNPEELLELVETVNMPNVGICYDIGHAHYMRGTPAEELHKVKDYLIALHIHDNDRFNDEHLLPYQGTVDWESVCRALADIVYAGDFTYETAYAVSRMPECVQPEALKSAYYIAEYLVSKIKNYSNV